jgi:RimJ/RimL family protein N-acetyltransferase
MFPEIKLTIGTREDVKRIMEWLDDAEVNSMWYGLGDDGKPLHIGYSPHELLEASDEQIQQVFEDEVRRIYSVYTDDGAHIGEGQLVVESPLMEAQLFLLVGRKDLWHHHYGTMAMIKLLDEAYEDHGLHRVWVDVPEYNEHALQMCQHLGFVLEGHLRKTHRKDGQWYDSSAMGLLAEEYMRRRSRLMTNSGI